MPWCSRRFERWDRQRSRWDSSPDRSGGDATTLLIQKQAGTRSSIQSAVHRPVMIWARMPIEFAASHENQSHSACASNSFTRMQKRCSALAAHDVGAIILAFEGNGVASAAVQECGNMP